MSLELYDGSDIKVTQLNGVISFFARRLYAAVDDALDVISDDQEREKLSVLATVLRGILEDFDFDAGRALVTRI